jgi:HPt (histidine-containing phosphotransfer) domain-containing protein
LGATILSQNNKELLMSNTIPTEPQEYLDFDGALEKIGDLPALRDLLDMFQVSLTRDIPKIESLLAQDNVFLANRMLHTLKGFIPIFCQTALCDEVAALEALSKTASAAEVATAYAALSPKLRKLQTEVAQRMV